MNDKRCIECDAELSHCGPQDEHGEPELDCRPCMMRSEIASLRAELEKVTTQRDNLLCRIHRDGGHYIAEHGIEKACEDADSRVATLNVESENLMEENKRLQTLFQGQAKLLQICDDVGNHPQEILRLQGELEKVKGERGRVKAELKTWDGLDQIDRCRMIKRVLGEFGE